MTRIEKPAEVHELPPQNRRQRRAVASGKSRFVDVRVVADRLGISVPSVWRGVRQLRIPAPCYPTEGCARWDVDELDAAVAATQRLPRENLAERRTQRLAKLAAATAKHVPEDDAMTKPTDEDGATFAHMAAESAATNATPTN